MCVKLKLQLCAIVQSVSFSAKMNKLNKYPVGSLDPAQALYPGLGCKLKLKITSTSSKINVTISDS